MMNERAIASPAKATIAIAQRLELVLGWYERMISEKTGRLVYTYDPIEDVAVADGSAIRNIASIWDMELLGRFLGRSDLLPLVERSLGHCASYLVDRDGALVLDSARLGEPSSIAHSAFAILALAESDVSWRDETILGLAEGILRQQRPDGSYKIYLGDEPDDGVELYPGEAMFALMYAVPPDARCGASVERGFRHYRERFPANKVDPNIRVFYANWQSQYAALLHAHTQGDALKSELRDYVFGLHDGIIKDGFYDDVERHSSAQATVEVACALEGLNDAYTIATRERDAHRVPVYEHSIRTALAWLFRAQRLEGCAPRERGGFGGSLAGRAQRIDVTGHVVSGLIKSARNAIES